MKDHVYENINLVYELSSLNVNQMTIPYNCMKLCDVISMDRYKGSENRIFPRIIPCFNDGCNRIYHIDIPEIHINEEEDIEFFYCNKCGIPSYCSEECSKQHWIMSHKELCLYFTIFPTFAKYQQLDTNNDIVLSTFDNNSTNLNLNDTNNWNLIY